MVGAALVALSLAYGEVRFNQGFGSGADASLCVVAAFKINNPHVTPEPCKRVWVNPVSMFLRLEWIKAIGQEVPSKCHGDGTCTVGPGVV